MSLKLTALLKTVVGKSIVGLFVVTSSVGVAAAAGADVPLLRSASVWPTHDDHEGEPGDDEAGEEESEAPEDGEADDPDDQDDAEQSGDEQSDEGESDQDEPDGDDGEAALLSAVAAETPVDDDPEEDPANEHGQTVSEFARENPLDLEGCAKGQATAAIARGDVDPSRYVDDDGVVVDEDGFRSDLSDHSHNDKCDFGLAGEEPVEAADDLAVDDPVDDDWKGIRDDGRAVVQEAQAKFVACRQGEEEGAGGESTGEATEGEATDDIDEPMSDECRGLLEDAKTARELWKQEWKGARDAAKAERKDGEDDGEVGVEAETQQAGKSERAGNNGRSGGNGNGRGNSGNNGKGHGKP